MVPARPTSSKNQHVLITCPTQQQNNHSRKHQQSQEVKMTMPPYDWTKHQARTAEVNKSQPVDEPKKTVPLRTSSLNGFTLRRMQSVALDRWNSSAPAAPSAGFPSLRRCLTEEEKVFSNLAQLRRNSDVDKSARRKRVERTKSAGPIISRREPIKKTGEAPKRVVRRTKSSQGPSDDETESRRAPRRTASSSASKQVKSGAPKPARRALSPIPRRNKPVSSQAA